ncbi:hypothetical protein AX16_008364 [Volvariella volvacea WC 439]|nr:hypothetical protein AX16_008364 [Volvariella volvacea WC 439]
MGSGENRGRGRARSFSHGYPYGQRPTTSREPRSFLSQIYKKLCEVCDAIVYVQTPERRDGSNGQDHGVFTATNNSAHSGFSDEDSVEWKKHINGVKHRRKVRMEKFQAEFDEIFKNKYGVEVDCLRGGLDFGLIHPDVALREAPRHIRVHVMRPRHARLLKAELRSSADQTAFKATIVGQCNLDPTEKTRVDVILQASAPGKYSDHLDLIFHHFRTGNTFKIARPLEATVVTQEMADQHALTKNSSTISRKRYITKKIVKDLSVWKPQRGTVPYKVSLSEFEIPRDLLDKFKTLTPESIDTLCAAEHQNEQLEFHAATLREMLWAEEYELARFVTGYDIENAKIDKRGDNYLLEVLNLAERRPSILRGDVVHIRKYEDTPERWYKGRVFSVERFHLVLSLGRKFKGIYNSNGSYHVSFALNRFTLRRQHQALEIPFKREDVVFPDSRHCNRIAAPNGDAGALSFKNDAIGNNEEQARAVSLITSMRPGSIPFIIFGPPGTGKSATIIEAVHQILHSSPDAHIFLCAPSNPAADLLCRQLACEDGELFRYYAAVHPDIPEDLQRFTHIDPRTNIPGCYTADRMQDYRVIVSTCSSASVFFSIGMRRGHFTHIFIDEAGQATEPETMVAIRTMADENTRIILAGDPKQLGPIVYSPIAKKLGLGMSYLERLMGREVYRHAEKNDNIVGLTKNYRSHADILKFPSDTFYNGRLQSYASDAITKFPQCANYLKLSGRNPKFPVVFHPVYGVDEQEDKAPSFFNTAEIAKVIEVINLLLGSKDIAGHDIGVIAPYRAHSTKIRELLRQKESTNGIRVGSVEEFQGQERRVIIVSTVRSTKDLLHFDQRHGLGFIADDKRFNVAMTRAQALLIVIGNPLILGTSPTWRSFLNYIHQNGGWAGAMPIPWNPAAQVDPNEQYDKIIREAAELGWVHVCAQDAPPVSDSDTEITTPVGSLEGLSGFRICKEDEDTLMGSQYEDSSETECVVPIGFSSTQQPYDWHKTV